MEKFGASVASASVSTGSRTDCSDLSITTMRVLTPVVTGSDLSLKEPSGNFSSCRRPTQATP